jgi:hypothetical protein
MRFLPGSVALDVANAKRGGATRACRVLRRGLSACRRPAGADQPMMAVLAAHRAAVCSKAHSTIAQETTMSGIIRAYRRTWWGSFYAVSRHRDRYSDSTARLDRDARSTHRVVGAVRQVIRSSTRSRSVLFSVVGADVERTGWNRVRRRRFAKLSGCLAFAVVWYRGGC